MTAEPIDIPTDEDRWENLAESAHAGPWQVGGPDKLMRSWVTASPEGQKPHQLVVCAGAYTPNDVATLQFIAAARTAVPALLHLIRMERRDAAEHAEERDRLIREADGLRAKVARIERLAARVADDDPGLADLLLSTLRGES